MSNRGLTFLAECQTEFEAAIMRSTLERNGVECYLTNTATATALSYVGTAIGGTQIHVFEDDLSLARKLTEKPPYDSLDTTEWYCTLCEEEQEAAFDVCWKCGRSRASGGRTISSDDKLASEPAERELSVDLSELAKLERDVVRAWRASLFGVVSLPVLLHLYSAFLLIAVGLTGEKLPLKTKKMFWSAAIIDLAVFVIVVGLILRL